MAIERVILELQEKVLNLTDEVDRLNRRVAKLEAGQTATPSEKTSGTVKIKGRITKKILIDCVQAALDGQIPTTAVRKGTRKEGSGLIITKGDHQINITLRGSGYYGEEDVSNRMQYTGFSTLAKKAIMDDDGQMQADFFVFGVSLSEDPTHPRVEFFVFDQEQFKRLLAEKTPSGAEQMYYFYFGQAKDGHYLDDRERNKTVLVDQEHNNWASLINMYQQL